MLAYRLLQAQTQPEFQDVPEPHARGARTTRYNVIGAILASQLQPRLARVDRDDSCAGQVEVADGDEKSCLRDEDVRCMSAS
jgi:hypothetical protein